MQEERIIKLISRRRKREIKVSSILYILMKRKIAIIKMANGETIITRKIFAELYPQLDERFILVCRGCVVSAMAIHNITKKVELINGEVLDYTVRKKKQLIAELQDKKRKILKRFLEEAVILTEEGYRSHYACFDNMPFAFTDIEMVFNEDRKAVDWIFRYGNDALAKLENKELQDLIGKTFGGIFPNMDSKWLRCYEQVALYNVTLEMIDYSPEIKKHIKVICFPTFKGHCGCILFDVKDIQFVKNNGFTKEALQYYVKEADILA